MAGRRGTAARRSGKEEKDDRQFQCDSYEDWCLVTEVRKQEDEDPLVKSKWTWYHGRVNRAVAEDQLSKSARFDGTFIVRESDAIAAASDPVYVISVLSGGETYHVEVEKREDGKYQLALIRGAKTFKTLKKLIEYYERKPLDLEGGGKIKLRYTLED